DDLACRNAEGRVSAEENKLNEQRLRIVEREDGFQVRDEDVIERSKKAPHEEERGDHRHGAFVGSAGGVGCSRCTAYVCDCHAVSRILNDDLWHLKIGPPLMIYGQSNNWRGREAVETTPMTHF